MLVPSFIRSLVIGLLSGLVGTGLMLGIWHTYNDHRVFHSLIDSIAQQQMMRQNASQTPTK